MTCILAGAFWLLLALFAGIFAHVWYRSPPGSAWAWIANLLLLLLIGIIGVVLFIYPVR